MDLFPSETRFSLAQQEGARNGVDAFGRNLGATNASRACFGDASLGQSLAVPFDPVRLVEIGAPWTFAIRSGACRCGFGLGFGSHVATASPF